MPNVKAQIILPEKLLAEPARLLRAVENGLDNAALVAQADFDTTVATWSHKPSFPIDKSAGNRTIGTDDEIYGYVNEGTQPHYVRPKRAKMLKFQTGYAAKSSPGSIGSRAGGPHGPTAFSRGHRVSGIDARQFDEAIRDKVDDLMPSIVQRAIDAAFT